MHLFRSPRPLGAVLALALVSCNPGEGVAPRPSLQADVAVATDLPAVRISEIHYDNTSTDAGEAIEISGPTGTDLAGWSVVLYNGEAMSDPRYPIGRFTKVSSLTAEQRATCIDQVAAAPGQFRRAVTGLTAAQLDTPYRDGGWTVRQVVHHLPDSHMNAYVRFKLGLTEDAPAIKTYEEKDWAKTPDVTATPVDVSLALLDALHLRWVALLRAMAPRQFARTITHPEWGTPSLDAMLALYAWHGRHHTAHVTALRERMGWA